MQPTDKQSTLIQRGNRYGSFETQSELCQRLKHAMRGHSGWCNLNEAQQESIEMIQHKVARIINGDPNYADSWHDISGYATLIENMLDKKD